MPTRFELVETQAPTTGALLHVYRAGGKIEYGSFQLEPPTAEEVARRTGVSPAPGQGVASVHAARPDPCP